MCSLWRQGCRVFTQNTLGKPFKCYGSRPFTFSSTHDYIVCGAGSAGCVLANRLSADSSNQILLLEAGPKDNTFRIQMPSAMMYNLIDDKYNWFYHTEPQEYLNNRCIYWPRGRVWGGSSSLNAMIYSRGHAFDYDRWESEGAKGWSYADCLPYFKKAQTHELGPDEYRGGSGPLHVTRAKITNPIFWALIEGGNQAGYPITEDYNGYQQEGFGQTDRVVYKGKRWNTSNAYLRPVLHRPNLKTETKAMITRILFQGNKAIGVEYHVNNQIRRAQAAKEVILSAGAVNSPQILLLSGIGDGNELQKLEIPVVCHLPGVGQNLQDHPQTYIEQECIQPICLHQYQTGLKRIMVGVQWFLNRKGPCGGNHFDAGAFIKSDDSVPHPDIQLDFVPISVSKVNNKLVSCGHAYRTSASLQRATSKGYIKLKTRNPRDHPEIQPNYLSTEYDRELLRKSVKIARHVFAQDGFKPFRGKEVSPGIKVQTDDELDEYIRDNLNTNYHPSCTCTMGDRSDVMAVVDNETRVHGVEGLRVVDASIMPSIISGNLNAPTIMIAEKAADHILGNELLPKEYVPVYEADRIQSDMRNERQVSAQQ